MQSGPENQAAATRYQSEDDDDVELDDELAESEPDDDALLAAGSGFRVSFT